MKNPPASSSTSSQPFTFRELYRAFRHEIETRDLRGPKLEIETVEDDESFEWMLYLYNPEKPGELAFCFDVSGEDPGELHISIGPITSVVDMFSVKKSVSTWASELADIAQMVLNGQLLIVLTLREDGDDWQAAELVWIDEIGAQRTLTTMSNHHRMKQKLHVELLRNHDTYPTVKLTKDHTLYPLTYGGKLILGRDIDLTAPTPLTKAAYNKLTETEAVMLMGGDRDEVLWQVFYRYTEFWLICLTVGGPLAWLVFTYLSGEHWWAFVLRPVVGFCGTLAIVWLTSYVLTRRQLMLDAGKQPLFERLESRVNPRFVSGIIATAIGLAYWYMPIWIPTDDHTKILSTLQLPSLWPSVTAATLVLIVAMVFVRPNSRRNKLYRTVLMAAHVCTMWYINLAMTYTGENAPVVSDLAMASAVVAPLVVLVWYITDIFRPVKRKRR